MRWRIIISLTVVLLLGQRDFVRAQQGSRPAITLLDTADAVQILRLGWTGPQPLFPGAQFGTQDVLIVRKTTVIRALCPDGSVIAVTLSPPQDILRCSTAVSFIGEEGLMRLPLSRGGRQDPTLPYLITPRGTLVRDAQPQLRWNDPGNVLQYSIALYASTSTLPVWSSVDPINPADVTQNGVASLAPPLTLEAAVAYSVRICAVFDDANRGCTNDPGWAEDTETAFYYRPDPGLAAIETTIQQALAGEPALVLYAQAILLGSTPAGETLGYYADAIDRLDGLLRTYSDHPLAQSPELYLRLGEWYRRVGLPVSALRAFARARELALEGTSARALALMGTALSSGGDTAIGLFDETLDAYAAFLNADTFNAQFADICSRLGDQCLLLTRCQPAALHAQCESWSGI